MASQKVQGGNIFDAEIREALIESKEVCIVFSPSALNSEWVLSEWAAAWVLDKRIVPLLYQMPPAKLPERLRKFHAMDFSQLNKFVDQVKKRQGSQIN